MRFEHFAQIGETGDWFRYHPKGRERVLLREAEVCRECGSTYLSLYPLRACIDHDGLDKLR